MTRFLLAALLAALAAAAPRAQTPVFYAARLDALFSRPPTVEVNLGGALLRVAASGAEDGAVDILRGLRSIVVRVYALDAARDGLAGHLAGLEAEMAAGGWSTLVRVRPGDDDPDDVWVYVRESGDVFDGMAVLSLDHDAGDASFVFIDGPIDPAHVGRLGGRFGVDVDGADDARTEPEREAEQDAADTTREALEDAEREMEDAAREARDEARDEARRARDEARQARDEARDEAQRARDAAQRERDAAYRERDAARDEAREAVREAARVKAEQVRRRAGQP